MDNISGDMETIPSKPVPPMPVSAVTAPSPAGSAAPNSRHLGPTSSSSSSVSTTLQSPDAGAEAVGAGAVEAPGPLLSSHGAGCAAAQPRRPKAPAQPLQPNNCIVLKNLHYKISIIELENLVREVLGGRKAFTNLSLVDDKNTGAFRGMAFINFHSVDEATAALPVLAALKVSGRKVVAEYRRLRPGEKERRDALDKRQKKLEASNSKRATFEMDIPVEVDEHGKQVDKRASFFAKRDIVKKADDRLRSTEKFEREKEMEADFRAQLKSYRDSEVVDGEEIQDVCFDQDLSSYERRIVHVLCDELNLGHVSRSTKEGSRVLFVTKDPERKAKWEIETTDARVMAAEKAAEKAALAEEKRKKQNEANAKSRSESASDRTGADGPGGLGSSSVNSGVSGNSSGAAGGHAPSKEQLEGIKWFRPRSAIQADGNDAVEGGTGTGSRGIEKPSYKLYIPPRQPTGPDGTIGFQRRNPMPTEGVEATGDLDSVRNDGIAVDGSGDVVASSSNFSDVEAGQISRESGESVPVSATPSSSASRSRPRTILNPSVPEFKFPVV
jgi:hypothetical protein